MALVGCVGALLAFPLLLTWELALSLSNQFLYPWGHSLALAGSWKKGWEGGGLGEIGSVTEIAGTLALVWNSKPPAWFVAPCFKNRLGF